MGTVCPETANMKFLLALCFLGAASAAVVPLTYSGLPLTSYSGLPITSYSGLSGLTGLPITTYSTGLTGLPLTTYSALPIKTITPISYSVPHPGYVAKTPGSTHIAPLPAGLGYASHHINLTPAAGTA